MTSKTCHEYTGGHCERKRFYRHLFSVFLVLLILILLTILIIFLVLRPTKPKFYLRDLTLSNLTTTSSSSSDINNDFNNNNFLNSNLQVTISSRNPNSRIGIYYDKLDVYADYKNQRITVPTALPTGYQGHEDFAVWSPFLFGTAIPVSSYLTDALSQDENAGFLLVDVKVEGKLRWKVGSWVSGYYHIYVNCPAFLTVKGNGNAGGVGCQFKFQQMTNCHVDV